MGTSAVTKHRDHTQSRIHLTRTLLFSISQSPLDASCWNFMRSQNPINRAFIQNKRVYLHVRTYKCKTSSHLSASPLVHRPKGVLLVVNGALMLQCGNAPSADSSISDCNELFVLVTISVDVQRKECLVFMSYRIILSHISTATLDANNTWYLIRLM